MSMAMYPTDGWAVLGQIAVVAVIGVMIYLGYRVISNSGNKNKKSDERRR